jgi:hypothetical protein
VEKYGGARETTDGNKIGRVHIACWVAKATDTHSEYIIHFAFPRQQALREHANSAQYCFYTYITCFI